MTQGAAGQSESRKALASLRAAIKLTGEARGLPETSELVKAIERLGAVPPVRPPDTSVLDRARRNLVAAANSPGGLAAAERRDLKFAPWLLWTGSDGIASFPGMFDILFQRAERLGSVRRSLIEFLDCELRHEPPDRPDLRMPHRTSARQVGRRTDRSVAASASPLPIFPGPVRAGARGRRNPQRDRAGHRDSEGGRNSMSHFVRRAVTRDL